MYTFLISFHSWNLINYSFNSFEKVIFSYHRTDVKLLNNKYTVNVNTSSVEKNFSLCKYFFRCFGETLSTLNFARRAKMIKNKAVMNEDVTGNVTELQQEIRKLKELLSQARCK